MRASSTSQGLARTSVRSSVTPEERSWIVLARSLDPDLRAAFLTAAEDIARGRQPAPFHRERGAHA